MIFDNKEGYYFDRIHILSWCSKWTLEKQLPINSLKNECKSIEIINLKAPDAKYRNTAKNSSKNNLKVGYRSKIEVIAPTAEFLQLLSENEAALGKAYRISYIEITHDVFCESAGDAVLKADILFDNLRKKYSFGHIYEKLNITRKELMKNQIRGLFAPRTFYSSFKKGKGTKRERFIYVIYARRSKINDKYCTHSEWRLTGSDMIRKKAHIVTVNDLCSFDFGKFFREKELQYLVKEKINILALDKWLKGYDGRKALTGKQLKYAGLKAMHYISNRIETYSDLVLHFKREKELIRKKCGARSEWDKKIMALRSYERFRDVQHE